MFAFILIGYSVLYVSKANDILKTIWNTDDSFSTCTLIGDITPSEANAIVQRLSMVPFSEMVKHDAWNTLVQHFEIERFNPEEWSRYESLIPHLPISVLEKINITDDSIMNYFGQVKLSTPQVTKLAEDVMSQHPDILENEEKLHKIGNIICGFNSRGIRNIPESVLRSLMKTNFFQKIKSCDVEHLRELLKAVGKHSVVGPPRTWHPETVKQVGILISGLTVSGIREIQEESFSQVSPEVIESTPEDVLKGVRDSQLKTLSTPALLSWRRRTQDLRPLYDNSGSLLEISLPSAAFGVILSNYLHFSLI